MPTFKSSDDISLYYTDEGEGLPILCLAGLTRNGTDFDYVLPHLTDVRWIRLDYRGRGRSEWADPTTYAIPTEMRDVIELLDHLGLDKVAILGTSRGGLIAMTMAMRHKERLLGVCLNDVGPILDPRGLKAIMGYVGERPAARTLEEAVPLRAKLMDGFMNVPDSRWREEVERHYVVAEDRLDINYDPRLREAVVASGLEPAPDPWPLFHALEGLPIALIRGENSTIITEGTANEMASRRPDMVRAEVKDRGHVPFLDEPEALEALRAWIGKLR